MSAYIQLIFQIVFTYIILLITTRMMGKREISQLSYFDYVIGITIGSVAANLSINTSDSFKNSLIKIFLALVIYGLLQILSSYISLKNLSFRKTVTGTKTLLIENGNIIEDNLKKERLNIDELTSKLREKNTFNLADVEYAFLEVDGKISVLKKSDQQSLTPSHLNIHAPYKGIGRLIVKDGAIDEDVLYEQGLTRAWLMGKLAEKGIYDLSKVTFAQVDENGTIFVDAYDTYETMDVLTAKKNADEILLAKLKKVHSDLLTYYSESNDTEIKGLYKSCEKNIKHVTQYFQNHIRQKYN